MRLPNLLIAALVLLDAFIWHQVGAGETEAAHFLDVGQGDSELVIFESGAKLLVDAGPDSRVEASLDRVLPDTDRYVDLAIITHAELDHYGGFPALLDRYSFGAILWNGREPDEVSGQWDRLKAGVAARNIPFITVEAGDVIRVGKESVEILSPTPDLWASAQLNDGCVVARVRQAQWTMLLTCDAGFSVERRLLESATDLRADILKVGHHGSRYSSNELFLRAVEPILAAIEVGARNSYGHPATLASSTAARVVRTDRHGTITVRSLDGKLQIFTERTGDK
jgi:competence protein ComEC